MPGIVHLELHTHDLGAARAFYGGLLGWPTQRLGTCWGSYEALVFGGGPDGGIVECATRRPAWLPYAEVERIEELCDRARHLGASVLLAPREGPAGWRCVLATPAGAEIALWQRK